MQVKKQKIFYNIKKSSVVRFGIFKRSWALSTFTQHGLRWTREKGTRHKHGANSVPGDALAISLTLSVISASICTSCKGLQGRVMEAYSEWSCPLKKFLKKQERKADHCDLERDICMEKLLFVCLYFFFFFLISPLSSPESKHLQLERPLWTCEQVDAGAAQHLTGTPGAGGFLIWSLAWRELYCSTGCCSPGRGNCWSPPRRPCRWPHHTACFLI